MGNWSQTSLAWNSVIIGCSILNIETTFSYLSIKHNQPPTVLRWLISNSINFLQLLAYKSIHIMPENTIVFWGFVQLTYSWKKFRLLEFEAFGRKPQSSIRGFQFHEIFDVRSYKCLCRWLEFCFFRISKICEFRRLL